MGRTILWAIPCAILAVASLAQAEDVNYVATVQSGRVLSGADALQWESATVAGASTVLWKVAYNGTTYLLVGQSGMVRTSTDTVTWTPQTSGASSWVRAAAYGPQWVIVGDLGFIATSVDGVTWTQRMSGTTSQFMDVAHNGSAFVAVGMGGTLMTSADGITWTAPTIGTTETIRNVDWDGTAWVVSGYSGTILRSMDGVTWTDVAPAGLSANLYGMDWDGTWVAVGVSAIVTSPDGITWTPQSAPTLYDVGYGNGIWTAVGPSGVMLYSFDGLLWHDQGSPVTNPIYGVGYAGGHWLAQASGGQMLRGGPGVAWTERNTGVGVNLYGAAYGANTWVAVGVNGAAATSPDGITWTAATSGTSNTLRAVDFNGTSFVAVGYNGAVLTSPDGVSWTSRTSGVSVILFSVYGDTNGWMAVGDGGTILTSADGITWTPQTSGVTTRLYDVAYNGSMWVVTTIDMDFLTSPDTITWNTVALSGTPDLYSVATNGTDWFAVGQAGFIRKSPDGVSWTSDLAPGAGSSSIMKVIHDEEHARWLMGNQNGLMWVNEGTAWGRSLTGYTADIFSIASRGLRPDLATSLVEASPTSITANGTATTTITVTLRDANSNPVPLAGQDVAIQTTGGTLVGSVVDHLDGTYSQTLQAPTVAGAALVTATLTGQLIVDDATVDFVPGPPDAGASMFSVSPTTLVADGSSTATVQVALVDAHGNALTSGGDDVAIATTLGTMGAVTDHGDGTYSAALTAPTTLGTATVAATVDGASIGSAAVTFTVGPAHAGSSLLTVTPTTLTADGASQAAVHVRLRDAHGHDIPTGGHAVSLLASLGTVGTMTDHGDGTYTAFLTAPTAPGTASLTAYLGAQTIGSVPVTFLVGPADAGNTDVDVATQVTAGATITITVTLRDAFGNVADGTLLMSAARGTLGTGSGTGVISFEYTAPGTPGLETLTLDVDGHTWDVTFLVVPDASFSWVMDQRRVAFHALAADGHAWTFGEGGGANSQDPVYVYETGGVYEVRHTATVDGISATHVRTIHVPFATGPYDPYAGGGTYIPAPSAPSEPAPPPTPEPSPEPARPLWADAGPDQRVLPGVVLLDGRVARGDPSWFQVAGPRVDLFDAGSEDAHFMAGPGTYTFRLTTHDADETASDEVTIHVVPAVTWQSRVDGVEVTFDAHGAELVTWHFGDGATLTGASVTHSYAAPGTYVVRVVADGQEQVGTVDITAWPAEADATPETVQETSAAAPKQDWTLAIVTVAIAAVVLVALLVFWPRR